jgi:hypothetical protein
MHFIYGQFLSEVMPTGDYKRINEYDLQQLKKDVVTGDKLFGHVECDIKVPAPLYEHFSEMCPILKKTLTFTCCIENNIPISNNICYYLCY